MNGTDRYAEQLKNRQLSYQQLMEERNALIEQIRAFEEKELKGDRSGEEWTLEPSPEVKYQIQLELLSQISLYMSSRYNEEFIWGDRLLSDEEDGTSGYSDRN